MINACRLCGAQRLTRIRRYRTHTESGWKLFDGSFVCACASCGFLQVIPIPGREALANYYASAYWSTVHEGRTLDDPQTFPRDNLIQFERGRSLAQLIASALPVAPAAVLDVGAGRGYVLHAVGALYPAAIRI